MMTPKEIAAFIIKGFAGPVRLHDPRLYYAPDIADAMPEVLRIVGEAKCPAIPAPLPAEPSEFVAPGQLALSYLDARGPRFWLATAQLAQDVNRLEGYAESRTGTVTVTMKD